MQENKGSLALAVALVAIVIAISGVFLPKVQEADNVGSAGSRFQHGISVNTNTAPASNGFKLGDNGTEFTQVLKLATGVVVQNRPITATTSLAFDFAVTGVVSGDTILALPASTTPSNGGLFTFSGCSASTTSGFITCGVTNLSGATAAVPYYIASSSQFLIVR